MIGTPRKLVAYLMGCEQDKTFELKEHREKRTLTQNAYYWSMLSKLKDALSMPSDEVHMNMLRQWGVSEAFEVLEEVPLDGYFKYYDVIDSYVGEDGLTRRTVYVYKESHLMTTAEFKRLIDGMREECIAQEIDVLTPEEIAKLRR